MLYVSIYFVYTVAVGLHFELSILKVKLPCIQLHIHLTLGKENRIYIETTSRDLYLIILEQKH